MRISTLFWVIIGLFLAFSSSSFGAVIVGITGGSGSGKTTLAKKIANLLQTGKKDELSLKSSDIEVLSQDEYFLQKKQPESDYVKGGMNLDHPSAMDFALMRQQLPILKEGKSLFIPQYDYLTKSRLDKTREIGPFRVLIFEGIHVLHDKVIREHLDYKVFVDFPDEGRLKRRIQRDQVERGDSLQDILSFYNDFVCPMYLKFIEPTKAFADQIVSGDSETSAEEIADKIRTILNLHGEI